MVAATPVNEKATVTVLRDGKQRDLTVKIAKLPSETTDLAKSAQPAKGSWGLQLHDLTPEMGQQFRLQADQGVVVVGVDPDSPAQQAGIQQGDVIVEVNRHAVNSVDQLKENIDKSKNQDRLLLLVQRQNGKFYVPLEQQG